MVVDVVAVVILEVAVLEVSLVTLDVVVVLVADVAGLAHISRVLGHPFDQSFRGAVCMSLTAFGCSLCSESQLADSVLASA